MRSELDRLQDLAPSLPVDADVQLRKYGYGGALSWKRLATIESYRDRNGNTRLMRAVRSSDFNQALPRTFGPLSEYYGEEQCAGDSD